EPQVQRLFQERWQWSTFFEIYDRLEDDFLSKDSESKNDFKENVYKIRDIFLDLRTHSKRYGEKLIQYESKASRLLGYTREEVRQKSGNNHQSSLIEKMEALSLISEHYYKDDVYLENSMILLL